MNYFLIVLLGWLLLFEKAVEVNQGKWEREADRERKEEEKTVGITEKEQVKAELRSARKSGKALIDEEATVETTTEPYIRVLLTDSTWQSYYHPYVTIQQNGREHTYTIESEELKKDSVLLEGGSSGIAISSITRAKNPPVYYGTLEIKKTVQGLLLINELPLETYLKGVVPSEMPSSYEEQALMAQAVCARTYAVCQMQEKSLKRYGADVDDSVNYQVYNNFSADEKTSKAVQETKGRILCQNGTPITAYYFSTSAGKTSTDEIWGATKTAPYLKSVECDFDQNMPWSSWSVEIPWETIESRAENMGASGQLKGIQMVKKSDSGAVTQMEIVTDNRTIQLEGEYEIREFFSPNGFLVTEKDGKAVSGGSLLPSAYFDLKVTKGQSVQIQGKGYGHGVGMSQNGANEMAKEGYTWQEILTYFFQNITLETLG